MLFLRILCTVIVLAYFCGLLVIPACDLLTSVFIPLNPDESCSASYVVWLGLGPKGFANIPWLGQLFGRVAVLAHSK